MDNKLPIPNKPEEALLDNNQFAKIGKRFAKLLHRFASDEIEKYQNGRIFPFPFFIDEKFLNKLNTEVLESVSRIPIQEPIEFNSITRFQDLSSIKFDSFEEFIEKAGNKKDPESAILTWTKFTVDEAGDPIAGIVKISLVTEKRLQTIDAAPGEYNHAWIELNVSGSNLEWVEKTYADIVPYINTAKLGGIFRPLWFFRNKWVINILSHVFGWLGFFVGIRFAANIFGKEGRLTKASVLDKIIKETDITNKFDIFVTQILTPNTPPWWEPIVVIGTGMVTLILIYVSGMSLFPKLAPNSSIAIGLSDTRARNSLNTFKFIIFTLLVSGRVMPLIFEIIKRLL